MAEPPWSRGTTSQLNTYKFQHLQPTHLQTHQVRVPFKIQDLPRALIEGKNGFLFKSIHKDTGANCKLQGIEQGSPEPLHILIEHNKLESLQKAKILAETTINVMESSYVELCKKKAEQQKFLTQKTDNLGSANLTTEQEVRDSEEWSEEYTTNSKGVGLSEFHSVYVNPLALQKRKGKQPKFTQADLNSSILHIANWNMALSDKASNDFAISGIPLKLIHNSVNMFDIVCLQNTRMNWGKHEFGSYTWHTSGSLGRTSYGVAVLVSNQNKHLQLTNISKLSECMCTAVFSYKNRRFRIICCYLPPPGNAWCPPVKLSIATQFNKSDDVFTILLGDFNAEIGTSDLIPEDLPRMGTSHCAVKSNENGLYLTSLTRSKNLILVSSLESNRCIENYHVFVNSTDTFKCNVFNMKKVQSPSFANDVLKFALRPRIKNDLSTSKPATVTSTKGNYNTKYNQPSCDNLWTTFASNGQNPKAKYEKKIMGSETGQSNYFQNNPFKRTFQESNVNPFEKFQPKISKMDPLATSSIQQTRNEHLFGEKPQNSPISVQQTNFQSRLVTKVPAPSVEKKQGLFAAKTVKTNSTQTKKQQNLESKPLSKAFSLKVKDKPEGADDQPWFRKVNVRVNNKKFLLRVVTNSLDSFYASIAYQLFPFVETASGMADLSRVLQQRTVNYIRCKKNSFFTDICNLYNNLFPDHGYDPDFTFEHGCLYLLSQSGGSPGEEIAAQAIACLFSVPIVILEELKCEMECSSDNMSLTFSPPTEILPESRKLLSNYSTVIVIVKRKQPENHYDILTNTDQSVNELEKMLKQDSTSRRK